MRTLNDISFLAIGAAFEVHREAGPGLWESVYEPLLTDRIASKGLNVERQRRVPLVINGRRFKEAFRADLIVENCLVIEIKSVSMLTKDFFKQTLTYARILDFRLGLLINFGNASLEIKRIVNNFENREIR